MKPLSLLLASVALVLAGCSKSPEPHHHAAAHAHHAPHDGTLVELGEHAYSLEFVLDQATGTLTAYVLDAHAENFIRIPDRSIDLLVKAGSATEPAKLTLHAVASSATGETIGDTSQFTAAADWLKTARSLEISIPSITIRGRVFEEIHAPLSAR